MSRDWVESGLMQLFREPVAIEETDGALLRARRTAGISRALMGIVGVVMVLAQPRLTPEPLLGVIGFTAIALTAVAQVAYRGPTWLGIEESLSGLAGILVIGFGSQQVTILSVLWLVAVASGVMARGGRVHWLGRNIVVGALALPVVRFGYVNGEYAGLFVATMGLLLTSGMLTRELNALLRQARLQAENAETLLLAGDIAARMAAERGERETPAVAESAPEPEPGGATFGSSDRDKLTRLIEGEGLSMHVQPIVDVRSGVIHAYEALARFDQKLKDGSPLHWFALAEEFGMRPALERACLRLALELFLCRPPGTSLSVNLSATVLLDPLTVGMLEGAGSRRPDDLDGLIIEITEETLVQGDMHLPSAIAPLRARGAVLAVDDMGAGYSGLRQLTTVHPAYLKLDRSLVTDIDSDEERAALVGALAGYSKQVGCLLVAEGVETAAELRAVRERGVPLVQGFYLSRPGKPWPELSASSSEAVSVAVPESLANVGSQSKALMPAAS
jgi:EAL domain-containing protein (putative c-di-GMP-specific phosphodiesterase class I)